MAWMAHVRIGTLLAIWWASERSGVLLAWIKGSFSYIPATESLKRIAVHSAHSILFDNLVKPVCEDASPGPTRGLVTAMSVLHPKKPRTTRRQFRMLVHPSSFCS